MILRMRLKPVFFQVNRKTFVNKYKGLFVVQNKISGNGYGTLNKKNDDKY